MDVFRAIAIITVSALAIYVYKLFKRPKGFPQGPSIFTSALALIKIIILKLNVYEVLHGWGKEYGSIFGINVGFSRFVVLDDYSSIRDGLKHPNFTDRFAQNAARLTGIGGEGIIFGQTVVRKFVVKNLKNLFGKRYVESAILNEVVDFNGSCKVFECQPTQIDKFFSLMSFNITLSVLVGTEIPFERNELLDSLNTLTQILAGAHVPNVLISIFPKFAATFPRLTGLAANRNGHEVPSKLLHKIIQHHRETFQIDEQRDVIDAYLVESLNTTDKDSPFHADNYERSLSNVLLELLLGSSVTTPAVLSWATLYLAKYNYIQEKFQREIDHRTNKSRMTNLADMEEMPFTQALIQETLRKFPVAQVSVRVTTQDTQLKCHDITKGTVIFPNILGLHEDPNIWGDPENFRPSRFLSKDGTKFVSREELFPFGAGKRMCPAKDLATNVVFLTLTNMFQKYNIELAPESIGVSTKYPFGFKHYPDFKIILTERN